MKNKMKNDQQYRIVTKDNFKIGDKVVRGRDFKSAWDYQDKGSVYGIIYKFSSNHENNIWYYVRWVDYKGKIINVRTYRIGPEKFDLYFYE